MSMFCRLTSVTRVTMALGSALLLHAAAAEAQLPPEDVAGTETGASRGEAPEDRSTEGPRSTPSRLLVHLRLARTPLTTASILAALDDEFDVPVQRTPRPEGLRITVVERSLTMSYQESADSVIERKMALPTEERAQLDTIALLAGSLARDEAGVLIAELQAQGAASDLPPPPVPPPLADEGTVPSSEVPTPDDASRDSARADAETDDESQDPGESILSAPDEPDRSPPPASEEEGQGGGKEDESERMSPAKGELPQAYASASFFGPISYPEELNRKKTYASAGFLYGDIGAVEGGAFSLFVLRNRGLDRMGSGFGLQGSLIATVSQGDFIGGVASLLVASSSGRVHGGIAGGLVALQRGDLIGAQGAGLVAHLRGKLTGAQWSGLSSTIRGELWGVQASSLVSIVNGRATGAQLATVVNVSNGPMEGLQLATLVNVSSDTMQGAELALVNVTPQLSGVQLGLSNVASREMSGVQVGLLNVAGEMRGTQVGLVNVGRSGKGTRLGLLNIASDVEGASVAPLNISPGVRNQVVVQASYAPTGTYEGVASGPLYHLGWKWLPDPVYTQLSFGFGPEAEECVSDGAGPEECFGGGWILSPTFAVGLRAPFAPSIYGEFDLAYQFEKGFNDSRSSRHGALVRAAAGLQLSQDVAVFVGGGPRVDFREGPRVDAPPEVGVGGHLFGGLAFF